MTLETNPDMASLAIDGDDLVDFRERLLQRDDYTCQRCRRECSAEHLHVHRRIRIEGTISHPSAEPSAFVTLCYPCHGVQHPDSEHFDGHRQNAPLFPNLKADPDVARVNTDHPKYDAATEAVWLHHRLFNRDNYTCRRCKTSGVSPHGKMDGRKLTAYFLNRPLSYGFACLRRMITVCHPCYRALQMDSELVEEDNPGDLLPHQEAYPDVALPRPPQTPDEEQEVHEFLIEYCLNNSGHTCARCREALSDTETGDLDEVHLYTPKSEETYDPREHVAICRPCAAVVEPPDEEFEKQWLPKANATAHENAHPWVATTKTRFTPEGLQALPNELVRDLFESDSHQCQRCTSRQLSESDLVAYPTFDGETEIVDDIAGAYTSVCRPCASVMYHDGDHGTSLTDLHSLESLDPDSFKEEREAARPEATYPVMDKTVDVKRGPVNRKERWLFNSLLSKAHVAWKIGGTISLATVIFFMALSELLWLGRDVISLPLTGWHSNPWLVVGGALILISLGAAATIRWVIADISSRIWNWIDPSIEPHHYRIDAANEWRRTLVAYGYLFAIPYLVLVCGQLAFLALLYLDWALSLVVFL